MITINTSLDQPGAKPDDTPVDAGLVKMGDMKAVQDQIESGMPDAQSRIDCARVNNDYYENRNEAYIEKREAETDGDFLRRPKRAVRLVHKAINTLGRKLYNPPPTRKLVDPTETMDAGTLEAVDDWLASTHKSAKVNTIMDAANKRAILNDCALIQVAATGDPKKPIKLWVYSAYEFDVFCLPDDPTTPWAVVTIAVKNATPGHRKRVYTLTTAEKVFTYETKPYSRFVTAGGVRAHFVGSEAHGYGVLPFAFFHNQTPVDTFWGGGIGTALRTTNAEIDEELSDLADQIQKFSCPDMFARNLSDSFRYEKRPGRPQELIAPASVIAGEAAMGPPEIFYVQPQINVSEIWEDVDKTTKRLFSDLDVPINASWDSGQSPTSGLQVIAQDAPYMEYLQDRQHVARTTEEELAKVVLTVAGNHYGMPVLLEAADLCELDMEFPTPATLVPTPERNADYEWRMQWGSLSPIELIMNQRGISRPEAEAAYEQIAKDRAFVQEIDSQYGSVAVTPTPVDASAVAQDDAATSPAPSPRTA